MSDKEKNEMESKSETESKQKVKLKLVPKAESDTEVTHSQKKKRTFKPKQKIRSKRKFKKRVDHFDKVLEEKFNKEYTKIFSEEFDEELCGGMSEFDVRNEEYYHDSWKDLCKRARTLDPEDLMFMDILILKARYIHDRKETEKKRHFFGERTLINLAFINTVLNSMRCFSFEKAPTLLNELFSISVNTQICEILLNSSFNIACVLISAVTAWKTSRIFLDAPKETWLRHMSAYSKITMEADSLFAGSGTYENLSDREKIKKFKARIVEFTADDYQNFFANMSGSKGSVDNRKQDGKDKNTSRQ